MSEKSKMAPRVYPLYRPRLPSAWWNQNTNYQLYMLRELSSVFVAIWAWRFIRQLSQLGRGQDAYARFVARQRSAGWVLFNLIAFAFAVLHAVTWFQLSGVVLSGIAGKVRLGGHKITAREITAGSFAGWAAASLGVLLALLLGGRNANSPKS